MPQGRGVLNHMVEDGGEVYSPCSGSVGGCGWSTVNRLALHSQGSGGCFQPRTPAGAASATLMPEWGAHLRTQQRARPKRGTEGQYEKIRGEYPFGEFMLVAAV